MKLLIADDSKVLRERIVGMLSELSGIEIIGQAKDTAEALESISMLQPDGVILDIRMPGGSGINVLKKIKMEHPSILVIMFTNYSTAQSRKRCLDLGADFFFDKSTQFDEIPNVLTQFTQDSPSKIRM